MRSIQQSQNTGAAQASPGIGVPVQSGAPPAAGTANAAPGGGVNELDAARAANWMKPGGGIWWPPNDGAVPGTKHMVALSSGTRIGRIGQPGGRYVAPPGTNPDLLALSPGTDTSDYHEYQVIKDIPDVEEAVVAPWFDKPGGGTQYRLPDSIANLITGGYLQII